jgi:hypothetical protein
VLFGGHSGPSRTPGCFWGTSAYSMWAQTPLVRRRCAAVQSSWFGPWPWGAEVNHVLCEVRRDLGAVDSCSAAGNPTICWMGCAVHLLLSHQGCAR